MMLKPKPHTSTECCETNEQDVYAMINTTNETKVLVKFVQELQTTHGINIKRWRMDNAGENKKTFEAFIHNKFGIIPEYSARETPQHNGTVERAFSALYGPDQINLWFSPIRQMLLEEVQELANLNGFQNLPQRQLFVATNERKRNRNHLPLRR